MTPPPRLVLRFAVHAGLALALAGLASVWATRALATDRAKEGIAADARFIAADLARDDLARSALDAPAVGDLRAELDELFGRKALGPGVTRATLYDREGRITYSTDHGLIGTLAHEPRSVQDALAGSVGQGVEERRGRKVLESYVPVYWLLSDRTFPAGVLRVERDYAPVAAEITDDTRVQAAVTLLALLLLYVSLFPILRRVTRRLAQREERVRALMAQATDAIVVLDRDGTIVEANDQAGLLLDRPTLVGVPFAELVDPGELERDPLRIDRLLAGETLLRDRTFVRSGGDRRTGELHAKMLEDGRILAIVRDVTERKEAERVLHDLEAELRRAQRAEATARLAAGVAHDFTNVLTAVAGNADIVLARLPEDDPLRRKAEAIQDSTARGIELVRQLAAFGRRPAPRPRVLDVEELLDRLEPTLRRLVGGRCALAVERAPGLGRVEADPRELESVVVGLVLDAAEAMPGGGTVALAAAPVEFARREGKVAAGRYLRLSVAGEGGAQERLGLELATAFGVVQRGGGTIGVETSPGGATVVRVYLPLAEAGVPAPLPEPSVTPAAAGAILVVEDEELVRALVREILEEQGYAVVEAREGREALALVEAGAAVDLVVTDLRMPDLGGHALAEALAERRPGCPVIAMSGSPSDVGAGVVFLQKPFTHETLTRTVRETLGGVAAAAV